MSNAFVDTVIFQSCGSTFDANILLNRINLARNSTHWVNRHTRVPRSKFSPGVVDWRGENLEAHCDTSVTNAFAFHCNPLQPVTS